MESRGSREALPAGVARINYPPRAIRSNGLAGLEERSSPLPAVPPKIGKVISLGSREAVSQPHISERIIGIPEGFIRFSDYLHKYGARTGVTRQRMYDAGFLKFTHPAKKIGCYHYFLDTAPRFK